MIGAERGDILIPSLQGEVLIIKNTLYVKNVPDICLEEKKVQEEQRFQNGDRLRLAGFLITLFASYVVIEGELSACICKLPPYFYKEKPFAGFPY